MSDIREHMEVVGADGVHVGSVERLENDHVILRDGGAIPAKWVERIDDKVFLDRTSEKALEDLATLRDPFSEDGNQKVGIVGPGGTVVMSDPPNDSTDDKAR